MFMIEYSTTVRFSSRRFVPSSSRRLSCSGNFSVAWSKFQRSAIVSYMRNSSNVKNRIRASAKEQSGAGSSPLKPNQRLSRYHQFEEIAEPVLMKGEEARLTPAETTRTIIENSGADTDDMFDDLLKKYGKVVFKSNDQNSPIAEVDDDAESLSFAVAGARVASDVKAGDIRVLFVKPLVYWTNFFIIATAFSRPQIDAIGTKIKDLAEKQYGRVAIGDSKPNSWTLLDFGDVVVHIFLPPERAFYNLEEFYANATPVDLPFENQPPFHS